MTETIAAVYEAGIFKPLHKIDFPEHKHAHLVVIPEEDGELLKLFKHLHKMDFHEHKHYV